MGENTVGATRYDAVRTCCTFCFAALAHDASQVAASPRRTYNLNPDWLSMTDDKAVGADTSGFDDSGWRTVTLPNAFNETEAFARDIKAP